MNKTIPFCSILCCLASGVHGQAGALDPTFNVDGIVITSMSVQEDEGFAIAVQPDSAIVVAGTARNGIDTDIILTRYLANGSLDTTFSSDGMVYTDIGFDQATGIALQPDGFILVCGWTSDGFSTSFLVLRYDPSGVLDSSFDSDGIVITSAGAYDDMAYELLVQPDGRIVVAGSAATGPGSWTDLALVRYNADGTMDNTFDGDGIVTTALVTGPQTVCLAHAVALQPDGKIIAAGWGGNDFGIARYEQDGSLDMGFGAAGIVISQFGMTDLGYDLALQSDGKVLLAGGTGAGSYSCAMARYNTDGSLDTTFGTGGTVVMAIGSANFSVLTAVLWQSDGNIIVSGYANDPTSHFLLARLTPDGTLDATFGTGGITLTSLGAGDNLSFGSALQPDGKILLCGLSGTGANADLALARYFTGHEGPLGSEAAAPTMGHLVVRPNPLEEEALLEYELAYSGKLKCELIDAHGRHILTFFAAPRPAGPHRETLDLSGIAAGSYTIALSNGTGRTSVQVVKQ